MTTAGLSVTDVFADAQRMHDAALRQMAAGDLRDAAEKAWCAAKRATDALVLARTGKLPPKSPDTSRALRTMAVTDLAVQGLQERYFTRRDVLHGDCFYTGHCEPLEDTELLIRETADYIEQARRLAAA